MTKLDPSHVNWLSFIFSCQSTSLIFVFWNNWISNICVIKHFWKIFLCVFLNIFSRKLDDKRLINFRAKTCWIYTVLRKDLIQPGWGVLAGMLLSAAYYSAVYLLSTYQVSPQPISLRKKNLTSKENANFQNQLKRESRGVNPL